MAAIVAIYTITNKILRTDRIYEDQAATMLTTLFPIIATSAIYLFGSEAMLSAYLLNWGVNKVNNYSTAKLAQSQEYHADRLAVELIGCARPLTTALQKISTYNEHARVEDIKQKRGATNLDRLRNVQKKLTSAESYLFTNACLSFCQWTKDIFESAFSTHPTLHKRVAKANRAASRLPHLNYRESTNG